MSNFCNRSCLLRQRGQMMLESLIGVVLTGIIGAGTAHIAARIHVGHHELRVQSAVVAQLRQLLNTQGEALCGSGVQVTLPNGQTAPLTVSCLEVPDIPYITVTPGIGAIGSVTVTPVKQVQASVQLSHFGVASQGAFDTLVVGTRL